jgi:hypothetical protein
MDEILIGLGFLVILGIVVLLLNPPEAWVKRVFRKKE